MSEQIRILIAKPGLDGHDRGAKVIAHALINAGFDVTYTGIRHTPEQIVEIAAQKQVHFIGLSLLSGAHNTLFPRVTALLKERGLEKITVFGGGVIPAEDIPGLKAAGIAAVFTPGTPTTETIEYIKSSYKQLNGE
jgi:methylmalonyl-CoA mutase C-terminal domain/subunit